MPIGRADKITADKRPKPFFHRTCIIQICKRVVNVGPWQRHCWPGSKQTQYHAYHFERFLKVLWHNFRPGATVFCTIFYEGSDHPPKHTDMHVVRQRSSVLGRTCNSCGSFIYPAQGANLGWRHTNTLESPTALWKYFRKTLAASETRKTRT